MALSAIILAAGRATRMKSDRVKVLHEICGRPMLAYVLDACRAVGVKNLFVVIGHDREKVMETFSGGGGGAAGPIGEIAENGGAMRERGGDITWVVQEQQKGTGHAVMVCRGKMDAAGVVGDQDHVFVLGGDGPLIRGETLKALADRHLAMGAAVTLATSVLENPTGYGRIVRDAAGGVSGIVEHNDATPEQRAIREVNPTYWIFRTRDLFEALSLVQPNNRKGEYYLTDTLGILKGMGRKLEAVASVPPEDVLSINTRGELADVARVMQRRIQRTHMDAGVTLVSPENTWIEFGALIGQDTVVEPFTWIGSGARVGAGLRVLAGSILPPGASL
jgi:bifunctional UDP-N-acetylglucosamine pyrophosphorylase/glucosamine-1-phosphate N-acetyltransferase